MISGKLRHRITVYEQTLTADGFGGWVETYSVKGLCWAEVLQQDGEAEQYTQRRIDEIASWTVKTRKNIGFTIELTDVILYKARYLRIQSIKDTIGKGFEIVMSCRSIGSDEITITADTGDLFTQGGLQIYNQAGTPLFSQAG